MAKRSKLYSIEIPRLPLSPGRDPLSKRARLWLFVVLLGCIVAIIVAGLVLALNSSKARVVTVPLADRSASAALMRAAEAVGFSPPHVSGAGKVEGEDASAGKELTTGLLPVGSVAPDFALRTPTGQVVRLRDLRGKAVLLEFFATWCPHCAAEAPHLRSLYNALPHKQVAFVAINGDSEDAASVLAYHIYFDLPFPAVVDPGAKTVTFPEHGSLGPVAKRYGVSLYPTFYVIDRNGRVGWRSGGEQPDALLARELGKGARQLP